MISPLAPLLFGVFPLHRAICRKQTTQNEARAWRELTHSRYLQQSLGLDVKSTWGESLSASRTPELGECQVFSLLLPSSALLLTFRFPTDLN